MTDGRIGSWCAACLAHAYTIDNGPMEAFDTELDAKGEVTFPVGKGTRRGLYSFLAFKADNSNDWIRAAQNLRVR